jgi:hypothetical protein
MMRLLRPPSRRRSLVRQAPKTPFILLIVLSAASSGCGRDSGQTAAPGQASAPRQAAAPQLIHSPPIAQLAAEQLRSLSIECEKYVPDKSTRGPYDAAYCEDAIAAWSDSPLQIVPIIKDQSVRDSPASPK